MKHQTPRSGNNQTTNYQLKISNHKFCLPQRKEGSKKMFQYISEVGR